MRPPLKIRRSVAKHSWDRALIDRATGEVLEPERMPWNDRPSFVYCEYCEGEVAIDDRHGSDFPHRWGGSVDGVVYGAEWGDDVGEWPVEPNGRIAYRGRGEVVAMTGLFSGLTPEQQAKALAYRGTR